MTENKITTIREALANLGLTPDRLYSQPGEETLNTKLWGGFKPAAAKAARGEIAGRMAWSVGMSLGLFSARTALYSETGPSRIGVALVLKEITDDRGRRHQVMDLAFTG